MSNQQLVPTGGDFGSQALANMSRNMQRQIGREIERVHAQAVVATTRAQDHEQGRAVLAQVALANVGALSSFEEHLLQVAPLGAARYEQIVNAYTLGASMAVARW